jgi:glycosyltransferase involved in cell wall biosynthesis
MKRASPQNGHPLMIPPLCPPEIPYPWTARGRRTRARVLLLEGSQLPEKVLASLGTYIPTRWNLRSVTFEARIGDCEWEPLHLSSLGSALRDGICILTPQALSGISLWEGLLLFEYAERHGLRTISYISNDDAPRSPLNSNLLLADTILCEDARVQDWIAEEAQAHQSRAGEGQRPQIEVWDGRLNLHSELISFPPLAIVAPLQQQSALLDCIRHAGEGLDGPQRVTWLGSSIDVAIGTRDKDDWLMFVLTEGISLADRLPQSNGPPGNLAVLVVGDPLKFLDDHTCVEELELFTRSVRVILFEEESSYRLFFERCCKLDVAIAILRRKAVLLSSGEEQDLIERLARCLRLRRRRRRLSSASNGPRSAARRSSRSGVILSICITTYNRAHWLRVTLPLIARETAKWRDCVELLVIDNTSTDDTQQVAEEFAHQFSFKYFRNEHNVGMVGSFGVSAKHGSGDYIWVLGDDDLVKPGTVSLILDALAEQPSVELIYLNYAYTHFDTPEALKDVGDVVARATPIAEPTQSGFYSQIWRMAALNENFFTSIFACVLRRDHAIAAYTQYTDFPPFSNMESAIPSTKYVLTNMMERPGYWIGTAEIVVNMNVSWGQYSPVWHVERFPEIFDLAEANGVPELDLRAYRKSNLGQALHFLRELGSYESKYIRSLLSLTRYIESMKRISCFSQNVDELLALYQQHLVQPDGLHATRLSAPTLRSVYDLKTRRS